ncbi:MAG: hypothetical protein RMH75_06595 [Archaeoglobaceae archaeon]|nr:hypothetical protein [Archaeoglobaceae archaeon]MDW7990310.1 hypothetical protein [Archaeoglobaceae archaeon]
MKISLIVIIFALFITLVDAKTEVIIHFDKEKVSIGEFFKISVKIKPEKPSSVEILISGKGEVLWLCRNESKISSVLEGCGAAEWNVRIPEDWESGNYILKVNIHEGSTTSEFSKTFEVIRPRILKIEIPELVYQGKKKARVIAEISEASKAKLTFKIIGKNFRFEIENISFDEKGIAEFYIDLRSKSIEALKPGYYLAELKLYYNGKLYDSRSSTIEIVNSKVKIVFNEEITAGEPLRVEIFTNREGDTEYNGIFVVFTGKNYKVVRFIELNEDGKAKAIFETAGLSDGDYKIYVRDTALTLKNIEFRTFSEVYYDLDPMNSDSGFFYAHDDVLIVKNLRIMKSKSVKTKAILSFEPSASEVNCSETAKFDLILSGMSKGLSSYEIRILVSNNSVARISDVALPKWATEVYKTILDNSIEIKAFDLENMVHGDMRVSIVKLELKGFSVGSSEIKVDKRKISSDEGDDVTSISLDGYLLVKSCEKVMEDYLENETNLGNFDRAVVNENSFNSGKKTGENENKNGIELISETKNFELRKGVRKPKMLQPNPNDLILIFFTGMLFVSTLLVKKINLKWKRNHGP